MSVPGIRGIVTASTGRHARDIISATRLDLAILDVELPDSLGTDLIQFIRDNSPQTRIIVNTMHDEVWFLKQLECSGVDGILLKSAESAEIVSAVNSVMRNEKYCCKEAESILKMTRRSEEGPSDKLTPREIEVLKYISEGESTVGIAEILSLSVNTVETHRRRIMEKLKAKNVADLIMVAISEGLIPLRRQ